MAATILTKMSSTEMDLIDKTACLPAAKDCPWTLLPVECGESTVDIQYNHDIELCAAST